jgi:hypothetical protein
LVSVVSHTTDAAVIPSYEIYMAAQNREGS